MIQTREYNKKRKRPTDEEETIAFSPEEIKKIENSIFYMKNRLPNTDQDKQDLIKEMKATVLYRKNWIDENHPTLSEILEKFPRYVDMPFLVNKYLC